MTAFGIVVGRLSGQASQGPTVPEVEAALAEVLARPDFLPATPSLMQRALTAGIRWFREQVWERLARLLPSPDWSSPAWETVTHVALTLGALLGLALIVYLVTLAVRALRRRRRLRRDLHDAADGQPVLTAIDWEARSAAAAERGDWREAAHALYQAVLLRLAAAEVVRVDASKTPGDYRREVRRARSELGAPIERFLSWFERLAYGPDGGGRAAFDRLRQAAAELGAGG